MLLLAIGAFIMLLSFLLFGFFPTLIAAAGGAVIWHWAVPKMGATFDKIKTQIDGEL